MATQAVTSWGRVMRPEQQVLGMPSRHASLPLPADGRSTVLPHGNGRSYGDSNLNPGGALVLGRQLDRFIEFDPATGLITCEAGVLLSEILRLIVPQGWFLPVTPGTQFVTVGGAIANDVHGKNHHLVGSFGNHVTQFELVRSDGTRRLCSPTQDADWFAATVGGLGLTGMITWAQIQLRRIANPYLQTESIRFRSLEEFFELSQDSEADHEYTVSWIDCAFAGKRLGRGLFNRANHAPAVMNPALAEQLPNPVDESSRRVPFTPPISLINNLSLKAFNLAYFNRQQGDRVQALQHYRPFFYPLDALLEWNRIYGPKGFYQYQCVVPPEQALPATRQLLQTIVDSGMGSFLAVLKQFGTPPSRGMLSFPMPGTTLALDFPNQGERLHRLFAQLDGIVQTAGGRLYPAKDGRMGAQIFKAGHPRWAAFSQFVDPRFSSGFWRRVMEST
ncbi:FAD-binding oxidoreductase [Aquabacterium sp. CECT 9606]|uniref:FAD-binding oxidoreductase n=1 Tax=Aquabacterium sp. CECT 9606 TaxID=2845822 RepID=UPI001E4D1195|nr:FAD-binding oxidoreductase [Aquabacterium sp. CECT 9606]CAH0351807.1 Decaprenylphosphoryl-beta-D-ribose oxidase [Aquabacterium sp. CECT 9606]